MAHKHRRRLPRQGHTEMAKSRDAAAASRQPCHTSYGLPNHQLPHPAPQGCSLLYQGLALTNGEVGAPLASPHLPWIPCYITTLQRERGEQ